MTTLATRLNARDTFDSLKPEDEQPRDREPEIKIDRALEKIIAGFLGIPNAIRAASSTDNENDLYNICLTRAPVGIIRARDVERFSLWLSDETINSQKSGRQIDGSRNAGMYLTVLATHCPEKEVTVHTRHLETRLDCFGYQLIDKHLVIEGDTGLDLGYGMLRGGIITIKGNADHAGPRVNGGKITIEGNCGELDVAYNMQSGEIEVYGNVIGNVGSVMMGGNIRIRGNAEGLVGNAMRGGEIIVEGDVGKPICRGMIDGIIRVNGKRPSVSEDIMGGVVYHRDRIIYDGRKSK